jgi:hypothetical protein
MQVIEVDDENDICNVTVDQGLGEDTMLSNSLDFMVTRTTKHIDYLNFESDGADITDIKKRDKFIELRDKVIADLEIPNHDTIYEVNKGILQNYVSSLNEYLHKADPPLNDEDKELITNMLSSLDTGLIAIDPHP